MNNKSAAILLTITNAKKFLTDNTVKLSVIEDEQEELESLDAIVVNANLAIKLMGKTPEITVKDLNSLKKAMSTKVMKGVKKALSKSRILKNTPLINMFTFPSDYISRSDKISSVQRAEEIQALLEAKKTILVNVKPIDITAIGTATANYKVMRDVPEMSIKNKKSFGIKLLATSLNEGRESLTTHLLMIEGEFEESDPSFVKAFKTIISVVILGIKHTPLNIALVDYESGRAIRTGSVSRTSKKGVVSTFNTNNDGIIPFKTHKAGDTSYEAKATEYETSINEITVKRGKENNATIRMMKKSI
jgi:hypothetical protein